MSAAHDEKWVLDYWRNKNEAAICTLVPESWTYHNKPEHEMMELAAEVISSWDTSDPTLPPCLDPNFGTFTMALPWGGEVVEQEDSYDYIKPVSDSIDEILDIVPSDNPHLERAIRVYRAVCERTGRRDIRFMSPDHQGVLSTAAMIMDQSALFMAMMTEPEKVHRFLDRVCAANLSFIRGLIEGAGRLDGNFWPPIWLPHSVGIMVVEDMMPLMSGPLYKEFGLPYLKRYADEFGGVFFHCCGRWTQHMQNLAEADLNLLGFEYHHPFVSLEDIQAHFDDAVVVPMLGIVDEQSYPDYRTFARHLIAMRKDGVRLWFASSVERGLRPEEMLSLTESPGSG